MAGKGSVEVLYNALRALMGQIRNGEAKLPVLDPSVAGLGRLCVDPDAGLEDVLRAVSRDPAVAAGVLKAAATGALNRSKPPSTLREACIRLGNRHVLSIAFGVVVQSALSCRSQPYASVLTRMWRHQFFAAEVVFELSRMLRMSSDGLQVVAVLHNVGEPLILHHLSSLDLDTTVPGFMEDLHMVVDKFHEVFGGHLSRQWELPKVVQKYARKHHVPVPAQPAEEEMRVIAVLQAARHLAFEAGATYFDGQVGSSDTALTALELSDKQVAALRRMRPPR